MSKINSKRASCKDVFKTFLIEDTLFDGSLEIPIIKKEFHKVEKLISFSKCINSKEYNAYVHFYEDDVNFIRIWNNPKKYLPILKKYQGIISPDFSLYRDFPLADQIEAVNKGRKLGNWFQKQGIKVIPNVRWSDKRSYKFCCLGVQKGSIISIGTHGTIKSKIDKQLFLEGLDFVIKKIEPSKIIVYGKAPTEIFSKYNIEIQQFESEYCSSRRGEL